MDISVIVVTYNQEDSIGRTLDSILSQQTRADFEIVIGDDCSTDRTGDICREYAARYPGKIVYLRREKNLGLNRNYFDCIRRSRGRYLADCAGDDYWVDNQKLEMQYDVLETEPDTTLVATDWMCVTPSGTTFRMENACPPGLYPGRDLIVPILVNKAVINLCSAMYRKSIIESMLDSNPEIMTGTDMPYEDLQIELACAVRGQIRVLDRVTLYYETGNETISSPRSFLSRYRHTSAAAGLSQKLRSFFLQDPSAEEEETLRRFFRAKKDYLMAMIYNCGPDSPISLKGQEEKWKDLGLKGKLYKTAMSSDLLWRLSLWIKNGRKYRYDPTLAP